MFCWQSLPSPLLIITGYLVLHEVPSNYSWEFSGGFAHVLMNNYCQLPGGVHQFFFSSALAPFVDIGCWDFCRLPRSVDLPCQWLEQQVSCPDGAPVLGALPWLLGTATTGRRNGPAVLCPLLASEGHAASLSFCYNALPSLGLWGPWWEVLVENKNFTFYSDSPLHWVVTTLLR